ncbi:MAG TPA: ABC transporter substrate-binding protein [Humibacter sp.]|nr:ABC transporter substrate-binding protein [Humibacter sp.]
MSIKKRGLIAAGILAVGALALSACSSGNPLAPGNSAATSGSSGPIVVGSAAFPENEIIAQIYTQALQADGVQASIKPNIGQRDAYLAALKDGSIDLVPEYTGNLLQYYDKNSTAKSADDVYAGLSDALPKGFEVLDRSKAEDKDSYNVTETFSQKNNVTSLADLKNASVPLKVAANPEFAQRPYGIPGLKSVYGVNATLVPISDSGGPNTVKALVDGQVQLADIYTTTPAIKQNHLVTLADPQNLIVAQNVVPLINKSKASERVSSVLDKVQAALTTEDLIEMNIKSSGSAKESAEQIAKEWLASKKLFS